MKLTKVFQTALLGGAVLLLPLTASHAQTAATWTGGGGDGLWNNAANWDIGVPGEGTNALIVNGNTVNYNTPMVAASVASLFMTNGSVLNINASGFTTESTNSAVGGVIMGFASTNGGTLNINSGGVVTVTNSGPFWMSTNGTCILNSGGTLLITNSLASDGMIIGDNKRFANAAYVSVLRMEGGTATVDKRATIAGSTSGTAGSQVIVNSGVLNLLGGCRINNTTDDGGCRFLVNGGSVNLGGSFTIYKSSANPTAGLVISNGVVNANGIQIGIGNSRAIGAIYGGVLTNTGVFAISDTTNAAASGERRSRFFVLGGTVVSTTPEGIIVGNQTNNAAATSSVIGGILDVSAGTLIANGITLVKDNTFINAYGTLNLSGSAAIYLGSVGLVGNPGAGGSGYFVNLSGGTLAASANYPINAKVSLVSGITTIQAADSGGNPFNISAGGAWIGAGNLLKTGGGTLLFGGTNTYSGNTLINAGTVALDVNGSLRSPLILIGNGAAFDVSAQGGAFSPGTTLGSQSLSGSGTVHGLVTATNGIIQAGSNNVTGALTFADGLTESGGVINKFILSSDAVNGSNDLIVVVGDLTVSGTNSVIIVGSVPKDTNYTLMQYSGTFSGDPTNNFALSGADGYITNIVATKSIVLHTLTPTRGPTNVYWVGNPARNDWDTTLTPNWLVDGSLHTFIPGDTAIFDATGAANTNVNVVGSVLPAAVIVNSAADYYFIGSGSLDGSASLTKTNSGTLTITTGNNYAGITTVAAGVLQVSNVANGNLTSPLGAASTDPANLVINSGVLRYAGPNASTDRGATLGSASSTIDVTTNGNLTISGALVGGGGLTKLDNGTLILSGANAYAGPTTLSNGTLQISGAVSALAGTVVFAGGTLSLNVGSQQTYSNPYNVATTGTLISAGSQNNVIQGPWSGAGTLNVRATGGTFTLNADMTTNFTGTIRLTDDSGATFRFNAGGNSTGAQQCDGSPAATFDLGNGAGILLNRNGGGTNFGTYYLGALAGGPATFLRGSANSGSPSTYQIGGNNLSTTFSGLIQDGFANLSSPQTSAAVSIVKTGTGTLTLNGSTNNAVLTFNDDGSITTNYFPGTGLTYSGSTTVSNGVLALIVPASPTNSPTVVLAASTAVLDVSQMGYIDVDGVTLVTNGIMEVISGQTVAGLGTIRGHVLADVGSTLNVGLPLGTLTVTNGIELAGAVNMNINAAATPNSSQLASSGITVDGTATLTVNNLGSEGGATFHLFNQAVSGFASVTLPPLTGTNLWVNNLNVDGSITLLAPPLMNLTPTNIVASFNPGTGTLTLSWPTDHIGWHLQSQTNTLAAGLGTNWVEVVGANATNQVSLQLDTTQGTVFFRMVSQ